MYWNSRVLFVSFDLLLLRMYECTLPIFKVKMKKAVLLKFILSCLLPVAVLSACTKTVTIFEENYLKLSDSSVSLQATGQTTATIYVYAVPAVVEISCAAAWIEIKNQTETSFDIVAADNDTGSDRSATVVVKVNDDLEENITVRQISSDHTFHRYRSLVFYQGGVVMSASGKYAGAFRWEYPEGSNVLEYIPVIVDIENDVWHEVGHYPSDLVKLLQPMSVSDDGQYIIMDCENGSNARFNIDGTYQMLPPPAGYTSSPQIASISADGTWVGWAGKKGTSHPIRWDNNGVAVDLPKPEKNFRGEAVGDVQARGISANGKIIYGTTWDNEDFGMIYWDRDNNYEVNYVGKDLHKIWEVERPDIHGNPYKYNLANGMWTTDTRNNVSPNGEWIAGTYRVEELSEDGREIYLTHYPAFYNTVTEETTIMEELRNGGGISVTSDGIGFTVDTAVKNTITTFGYVVDIKTKTVLGTCTQWIAEMYGIHVPSGWIQYVPEHSETVLGASMGSGGPSVEGYNWLVLPER